jgi:hypothetical protein
MRVFVSHASADRELVENLVELLVAGAGLARSDIFCTSIAGMGVPNGEDFVNRILKELRSSTLVIAILSESYFDSPFCIAEVGAAQIKRKTSRRVFLHALMVPPASFDTHLRGILYATQAGKIDVDADLDELKDRLPNVGTALWNKQREIFLNKTNDLIKKAETIALLKQVKMLEIALEIDLPGQTYSRKLRVTLRNQTGHRVHLENPTWERGIGGVDVHHPYLSRYQRRTNKEWSAQELETIDLDRGQQTRLWLGLDPHRTEVDLRMLQANRELGIIAIPATIQGVSDVIRLMI